MGWVSCRENEVDRRLENGAKFPNEYQPHVDFKTEFPNKALRVQAKDHTKLPRRLSVSHAMMKLIMGCDSRSLIAGTCEWTHADFMELSSRSPKESALLMV